MECKTKAPGKPGAFYYSTIHASIILKEHVMESTKPTNEGSVPNQKTGILIATDAPIGKRIPQETQQAIQGALVFCTRVQEAAKGKRPYHTSQEILQQIANDVRHP